MIEYHNPDARVGVEETPYDLSVTISPEESTSIGLLANGFPDSVEFLNELGAALQKFCYPSGREQQRRKTLEM